MPDIYTRTHVATQLSSSPTLLCIPNIVQMYLKNDSVANVLTPSFLRGILTEADWMNWYKQQLCLGDITPLQELMPAAYITLARMPTNPSNQMTGTKRVVDTKDLTVAIDKVVTTKPDSQYIAIFNKSIDDVSAAELSNVLNRELLLSIGIDVYAKINRGSLFKNALILA